MFNAAVAAAKASMETSNMASSFARYGDIYAKVEAGMSRYGGPLSRPSPGNAPGPGGIWNQKLYDEFVRSAPGIQGGSWQPPAVNATFQSFAEGFLMQGGTYQGLIDRLMQYQGEMAGTGARVVAQTSTKSSRVQLSRSEGKLAHPRRSDCCNSKSAGFGGTAGIVRP